MDRRINACRHEWDYEWKRCRVCGLSLHRFHSSLPKREARAKHRERERRFEWYLRQAISKEE